MNGLSKYKRVMSYLSAIEKEKRVKKTPEVRRLHRKLQYTGYKLRTLETIRTIAFILLYSSITSTIISVVPGFETFSRNIIKFSSLIGSTIFIGVIAVTSKMISLYMLDLQLISSHIISIYKYQSTS